MAESYGIKTIQGYSGQQPGSSCLILKYWNSCLFPTSVMRYKSINAIQDDIYLFNVDTNSWSLTPTSLYPVLPDIGHSYSFSQERWATFLGCFYEPKDWGRWIGFNTAMLFQLPKDTNSDLVLTLKMFSRCQTTRVQVSVNGAKVAIFDTTPTACSYPFVLPRQLAPGGRVWITLYISPKDIPGHPTFANISNPVKPLVGLVDLKFEPFVTSRQRKAP